MCIFFAVVYEPSSVNVPVCVENIIDTFCIEVLILALHCLFFLYDILPCPRCMFYPESDMAVSWFDLVVFAVLTE